LLNIVTALILIALTVAGIMTFMMISIFRPVSRINDVMGKIVTNDYNSDIVKKQDNELVNILDLIRITQSRLQFEIFEAKAQTVHRKKKVTLPLPTHLKMK